jgi:hypothetical protein
MLHALAGLAAMVMMAAPSADAVPVLTLRAADRVIDRAFATELAGDFEGARDAVRARLQQAKLPEEEPGRQRLIGWLRGLDDRAAAYKRFGRTAQGYWRAFQTLRPHGPSRSDLLWGRALRDVPELQEEFDKLARVHVRIERVVGVAERDLAAWAQHLTGRLGGYGVRAKEAEPARYEVRVYLDAADAAELMGRSRVTVESSYVLRTVQAGELEQDERVVGTFNKRRSVTRPTEDGARRFGVRRVMDDLGWSLVYQLREDVLRDLAAP